MNILQRAVFPKINLCTQLDLYFRVNEFADINLTNSFITLDNKGYFSTDTYFNSLSIGKWKRYTAVEDLYFSIKFKGKIKLVWYVNRLHFSPKIMKEVYLENFELSEITIPLELWEDVEDGMLAFYISAFSYSEIYDFSYKTTTKESHIVNLGIVITHFNRQKYVLPALQRLKNELLSDDNFNDKVSLYVVDNSQNLPSVEDVTIIPNENLGGSGGFSRGLIELKEKGAILIAFLWMMMLPVRLMELSVQSHYCLMQRMLNCQLVVQCCVKMKCSVNMKMVESLEDYLLLLNQAWIYEM